MVEFLKDDIKWRLLDYEGMCKEVEHWESGLDNRYEHRIIKSVMQGMMDLMHDYLDYMED